MRLVFGGMLVKKQRGTMAITEKDARDSQVTAAPGLKNLQLQRQQIEQQVKQSLIATLQG